jgi:hypothetical protein
MNFTHKGDHQVAFDCLCQHPAWLEVSATVWINHTSKVKPELLALPSCNKKWLKILKYYAKPIILNL